MAELNTPKVLFAKVSQILNLVRLVHQQHATEGVLPQVDFIVDKFDRTSGMGRYWGHSQAFRPNGAGADIIGGANAATSPGFASPSDMRTTYGPTSAIRIVEPVNGYPMMYSGNGMFGIVPNSAGVATYQAQLRGNYTIEMVFYVPDAIDVSALSVCLLVSATGKVSGGMFSALGSRANAFALDIAGNGGQVAETHLDDGGAWGLAPTGAIAGNVQLTTTSRPGQIAVATFLASSILADHLGFDNPQLVSIKAYVDGVTPPDESGHGTIDEDDNITWFDAYHDADGNYDPSAFE